MRTKMPNAECGMRNMRTKVKTFRIPHSAFRNRQRRKPLLSPHDGDLVKRDAAIPGLATLLDPAAFLAALRSALPGAGLDGARAAYVRYKPSMNCLVAYEQDIAGTTMTAYAKGCGPNALDHRQKALRNAEYTNESDDNPHSAIRN